jgi:NAD(P)-dependent dehydrogenase (short-subunit alcohol dehydrogenase family)
MSLWEVLVTLKEFMVPHAIKWDTVETIPSGSPFAGQSIIVTGANSGLGLEAAIHYVQNGAANVYITARNEARGAAAQETIEARTGKKDVVKARVLDMDTFEGVKSFVDGLKKDVKSIGWSYLHIQVVGIDLT